MGVHFGVNARLRNAVKAKDTIIAANAQISHAISCAISPAAIQNTAISRWERESLSAAHGQRARDSGCNCLCQVNLNDEFKEMCLRFPHSRLLRKTQMDCRNNENGVLL